MYRRVREVLEDLVLHLNYSRGPLRIRANSNSSGRDSILRNKWYKRRDRCRRLQGPPLQRKSDPRTGLDSTCSSFRTLFIRNQDSVILNFRQCNQIDRGRLTTLVNRETLEPVQCIRGTRSRMNYILSLSLSFIIKFVLLVFILHNK